MLGGAWTCGQHENDASHQHDHARETGDYRLGSAKERDYENQRGGNDERPHQLGALIAAGVFLEIADVCPGPGRGDHCFTFQRSIAQDSRPLLFSPAILLLLHAFGISTVSRRLKTAKRTTPISSSLDSVKNSNQGEISCTNAWPIGRSCEQERIRGQLDAFETSSGNARSLRKALLNHAVYPVWVESGRSD